MLLNPPVHAHAAMLLPENLSNQPIDLILVELKRYFFGNR